MEQFEIPQFRPAQSGKFPFDLNEYLEQVCKRHKDEYEENFYFLMRALQKGIDKGNKKITIKFCEQSGCYNTSVETGYLADKALENFLYLLGTKGYPFRVDKKSDRTGDYSDGGNYYNRVEIAITLA